MTHPHITLTIEQARQIRTAIDDAIERHLEDATALNYEPIPSALRDAAKILSTELECLRYL